MLQNRFQIITAIVIMLSIQLVFAVPSVILSGRSTLSANINSSDFWDSLDNPSNILLDDLGDVNTPSPSNNQVLTWDTATSRWIAKTMVGTNNNTWNESYANGVYAKYNFTNNNFNGSGNFTTTGLISSDRVFVRSKNLVPSIFQFDDNGPDGSILEIFGNSTSPVADDYVGTIKFQGNNGNGAKIIYSKISSTILSTFPGSEEGGLIFSGVKQGELIQSFVFNSSANIFNAQSKDVDFLVRGDTDDYMFFGDASSGNVGIRKSNPLYPLHVLGNIGVTNGNIGIGVAPTTYNGTGEDYVLNLARTFTDNTTLGGRKSVSANVVWNPVNTGTITQYILGGDFSVDTTPGNKVNNSGYLVGQRSFVQHRANSTMSTIFGNILQVGTYDSGADTKGMINLLYGQYIEGLQTPNSIINNSFGLFIFGINGSENNYDLYISDVGSKNYLAGYTGIGITTPLYPLHVGTNTSLANQSISILAMANISATGFITRTSVFDETKGSALDLIKDASEYKKADGTINHSLFYGYVGGILDTDYSRPISKEVCGPIDETTGKPKSKCQIITTYPYTKVVEGVELGAEIDVLRQAIYELKIENERIKDCVKESKSWEDYKLCIK